MNKKTQYYEALLLGTMMKYPELHTSVPWKHFSIDDYKNMANELVKFISANPNVQPRFEMFFGEKYSAFSVQSLIDFTEKNAPKTIEEAKESLGFYLAKFEEEQYSKYIYNRMNQAQKYLDEGDFNGAVVLLKNLQFRFEEKPKDTLQGMIEAIDESNGFKSGIDVIDEYAGGWYMGNLLSLCGDTGSQKTRSSLFITFSILKANPSFKAVYFEKEMTAKDVYRMLLAYLMKMNNDHIIKANSKQKEELKIVAQKMYENNSEIKDLISRIEIIGPTEFSTAADVWRIVSSKKCDVWVLDYMSLLDNDAGSSGEKAHIVADSIKQLKNLVHTTNSFGIILNQLRKGTVESRTNKIPLMDDIEWSGDIKKLSAYVISTFYPNSYYTDTPKEYFYLCSLKNRFKTNYVIPLVSHPEYVEFRQPDEATKLAMIHWMRDYHKLFPK